MFGVAEENLTAVTCFRLDMVARPRFSAQLFAPTATTPGTFAFLLGDAANAIHFWPGRGLNSGLASTLSPARSLAGWRGRPLRDADFVRHEAIMGMLQYRHKSRAWRQMVTADETGALEPIKDLEQLTTETLHTLVVSEPWDSGNVGGEEVDVDWLLPEPESGSVPAPRRGNEVPAARGWSPVVV